jgi:hypothetical protein
MTQKKPESDVPGASEMMSAWSRAGDVYSKACSEWQEEVMRFANRRLEQNTQMAEQLARCQGPMDVARLQQEWAMSMTSTYFEEMNRLMSILTRCATGVGVAGPMAGPPGGSPGTGERKPRS